MVQHQDTTINTLDTKYNSSEEHIIQPTERGMGGKILKGIQSGTRLVMRRNLNIWGKAYRMKRHLSIGWHNYEPRPTQKSEDTQKNRPISRCRHACYARSALMCSNSPTACDNQWRRDDSVSSFLAGSETHDARLLHVDAMLPAVVQTIGSAR